MNEQLASYIKEQTALGVPKETIIQNLKTGGGWSEDEIEAVFSGKTLVYSDFDYKRRAEYLIWAGCVGLLLSFAFLYFSVLIAGFADDKTSSLPTFLAVMYYVGNSVLLLASGTLLTRKSPIGFYLFITVLVSIVASFFVTLYGENLFIFTFKSAITLIFSIPFLAFFWLVILYTVTELPRWYALLFLEGSSVDIVVSDTEHSDIVSTPLMSTEVPIVQPETSNVEESTKDKVFAKKEILLRE